MLEAIVNIVQFVAQDNASSRKSTSGELQQTRALVNPQRDEIFNRLEK
jgi:hypothetical protein